MTRAQNSEMGKDHRMARTHRVGSLTFGGILIVYGLLFLHHVIWPGILSYRFLFRLWPFIFIALGSEVLVSSRGDKPFVYDTAAIVLLVVLAFFAMSMAGADWMFEHVASAAAYSG